MCKRTFLNMHLCWCILTIIVVSFNYFKVNPNLRYWMMVLKWIFDVFYIKEIYRVSNRRFLFMPNKITIPIFNSLMIGIAISSVVYAIFGSIAFVADNSFKIFSPSVLLISLIIIVNVDFIRGEIHKNKQTS